MPEWCRVVTSEQDRTAVVGRDSQLNDIFERIETAGAEEDQPNVLFITGEAGIGKSTLLAAVREECRWRPDPPVVVVAECSTPLAGHDIGEVEALQPWEAIIGQLAGDDRQAKFQTRQLIADLAMAWVHCIPLVGDVIESVADTATIVRQAQRARQESTPPTIVSQQQKFQQYINLLVTLSERAVVVIMIDDFHWADASSTNLLFSAARQLRGRPILFVIAYRADDAATSRDGTGHPLLHVRNELERYGLAVEIDVPRLTAQDLSQLLSARYPLYRDHAEFERWMLEISGGNALFITQFIDALEEEGIIDVGSGTVRDHYVDVSVPRSVHAVVKERLRRIDMESMELLRYASVEGEIFTAAALARVTETAQLKLLQRLRLLEESSRLLQSIGRQRIYARETTAYRFNHALVQRILYESLSTEERELVHEALFEFLKEEWESLEDGSDRLVGLAARLVAHATVLGRNLFAAEVALAGARKSLTEYALDESVRQAEEGLRLLDHVEARSEGDAKIATSTRARLLYLCGQIEVHRGRFTAAMEDLQAARSLFEAIGAEIPTIDVIATMASLLKRHDRYDEAGALAEEILDRSKAISYHSGEASGWGLIGSMHFLRSRYEQAYDCYMNELRAAEASDDSYALSRALNNVGVAHAALLRFAEALEYHDRSLGIKRAHGDRSGEAASLTNIGSIRFSLGDYAAALKCFLDSRAIRTAVGDVVGEMREWLNVGETDQKLGDRSDALDAYRRAFDLAGSMGLETERAIASGMIGSILREEGALAEARPFLEDAVRVLESAGVGYYLGTALGELALLERDEATALEGAVRVAKLGEALSHLRRCVDLVAAVDRAEALPWRAELERIQAEVVETT